jgi:OmpA family protein
MISRWLGLLIMAPLLGACATVPNGPSVMVLPGSSKSFEEFQADDAACRQWASQQTGMTAGEAANKSGITSAAIGTLLGAALGAAIGAAAGNPALGAAAGAGGGFLFGSSSGLGAAQYSGAAVQQRYDNAYQQCMYAKGNQIPGVIRNAYRRGPASAPPPPPPPPAGWSPTNPDVPGALPPPPPPPSR